MSKKNSKKLESFQIINEHAAGIDVGSRFHQVSVGDLAKHQARFGVFTADLHKLAQFLLQHQIKTVALESTGFYWKNLYVLLSDYGFEVVLVNPRSTRNINGKKTDKADAIWIRKLHSVGFLDNSFQPDLFTEVLRTHSRHRKSLIRSSASYIQKMQKCLILMNLQLPLVLSDISGVSGMRIIEAILAGERNASKLASMVDGKVKADQQTITKALTGFWREDCLFELQQCYDLYQIYRDKIRECDVQIEQLLQGEVERREQLDGEARQHLKPAKKKSSGPKDPKFDLHRYLMQLSGTDLSEIPGVGKGLIQAILSEVGTDLKPKFPSAKHFTSWLKLAPNNKISGGRILSSKTLPSNSALRIAFRDAANTIGRLKSNDPLTVFFKGIVRRKGRAQAVTATARKLAALVYKLLTEELEYQPIEVSEYRKKSRQQDIRKFRKILLEKGISPEELLASA